MGLLRLIATAALVWFVFRWLDRFFGPNRSRTRPGQSMRDSARRSTQSKSSAGQKPKDDTLGDYVEFEEVDES